MNNARLQSLTGFVHNLSTLWGIPFLAGIGFFIFYEEKPMEAWKVHKFCEGASLKELLERKEKLSRLIEQNHLSRTNADQVMGILEEYIELKTLFDED